MATKNVIEEYYIDIKARADAAEKDITKALANIAKNSKKMNERMNALELKLKGKTITDKMDKDKEYNIVQDALRKKNLADEQAANKREIDLAKIAYKKKMRLLKEQQRAEELAAMKTEALNKKIQSYKETDYYRRVQEANPMAAAKYDRDFKNAKDINEVKDVAREVRRASRDMTRSMNGLAFAQNGLRDSTRNMIRSYVSLFALFEGTRAIKNVGMDLQSLDAAMLAASKNQADAGNKMKFVKEQAFKLGTDLKTAAKAYMQLSIASKGILSQKETDALFVATLESATALGMSLDDTQGTFRSFVQMLSKG